MGTLNLCSAFAPPLARPSATGVGPLCATVKKLKAGRGEVLASAADGICISHSDTCSVI